MPKPLANNLKTKGDKIAVAPSMKVLVAFKMLQGALLLGVGVFLLSLRSRAADLRVMQFLARWQLGSEPAFLRHWLGVILWKLGSTDPHRFALLGVVAFGYALVTLTEGVGLRAQKFWAEYLTVGVSASFVPLEIWEIAHHPKIGTLLLLASNLVIVAYLVNRLRLQHCAKMSRL